MHSGDKFMFEWAKVILQLLEEGEKDTAFQLACLLSLQISNILTKTISPSTSNLVTELMLFIESPKRSELDGKDIHEIRLIIENLSKKKGV